MASHAISGMDPAVTALLRAFGLEPNNVRMFSLIVAPDEVVLTVTHRIVTKPQINEAASVVRNYHLQVVGTMSVVRRTDTTEFYAGTRLDGVHRWTATPRKAEQFSNLAEAESFAESILDAPCEGELITVPPPNADFPC
jgi:hypothetical protein